MLLLGEGTDDGLYDGIDIDSEGEEDESGSGKKDASQASQDSNEVRKRLFSSKIMRVSNLCIKKLRDEGNHWI